MATYNFLDKTGLGLVWAKIKALIPSKTSDLQNDSGFITASDIPEEIFTITVSQEYDEQTEAYAYTKNKTDSEIAAAYEAGKQLIVVCNDVSGSIFRLRDIYAYNGYLSNATFINDCQELILITNGNGIEYINCLFNLHTYQSGIVEDYNHAWYELWQVFTNGRAYIVNPQGSDRPPIIPSINMDWENFVSATISFINDQGDIVRLSGRSETSDGTDNIVMNAAILKSPLVVNITYNSQTETYSADNDFYTIKYAGSDVVCIYQDENYQNKYYYYDHTYSEQTPNNQTNGCIVFSSLGSVTQNNGVLQANSDCFIISQINASGEPTVVTRATFSQPIGGSTQSDWSEDDSSDDAYILNRPAIRAGDGTNSIVEGQIDNSDATILTIYITGAAKATTFTYTTEEASLPTTSLKSYFVYISSGANKYQKIEAIDTTNHTITFTTLVANTALNNAEAIIYKNYQAAISSYSHAEGESNVANGVGGHAEGRYTLASSIAAHSEGNQTAALGTGAHSEGSSTIANGIATHAEGSNTIAHGSLTYPQHVEGKYNIYDENMDYAHIVGNGTSSTRSNAYTLDWSGNGAYAGKVTVGAGPTNNMDVATKQYVDNAIPTVPDEVMTVTISQGGSGYVADKTFSEMSTHLASGGTIICNDGFRIYQLNRSSQYGIYFTNTEAIDDGEGGLYTETRAYSISSDGSIEFIDTYNVIPQYTSQLTNDSGFITSSSIPTVPDDLGDLTDTAISSPSNGQVLKYNSTTSKWVNADETKDSFVITVTSEYDEITGAPSYTKDKTNAEILAAYRAGQELVIKLFDDNGSYRNEFSIWFMGISMSSIQSASFINHSAKQGLVIDSSGSVKLVELVFSLNPSMGNPDVTDYDATWSDLNNAFSAFGHIYIPSDNDGYIQPVCDVHSGWEDPSVYGKIVGKLVFVNNYGNTMILSGHSETQDGSDNIYMTVDATAGAMEVDINEYNNVLYSNKTYAQICEALNNGIFVYAGYGDDYDILYLDSKKVWNNAPVVFVGNGTYGSSGISRIQLTIASDDTITVNQSSLNVPAASSTTPSADGTGSAGSSTNYARADHVHPKITQTISMTNNVITLTGSDGTTSSVTLPVYNGGVVTLT